MEIPKQFTREPRLQQTLTEAWTEYKTHNLEHKENPTLFWEAAKAVRTGNISYTTKHRKATQTKFTLATRELRTAQLLYQNTQNIKNKEKWLAAKRN